MMKALLQSILSMVLLLHIQLEEKQRSEARERKEKGTEWQQKVKIDILKLYFKKIFCSYLRRMVMVGFIKLI